MYAYSSPRCGHRALAVSKGGRYRLTHTHSLCPTIAVQTSGQSPIDARRARLTPRCSILRARLPTTSTLITKETPVPLNTNNHRIQTVLVFDCRVSPPLALRASLPAVGSTGAVAWYASVWSLRVVGSRGRFAPRRAASPAFPP